jgi:hypothetical protein
MCGTRSKDSWFHESEGFSIEWLVTGVFEEAIVAIKFKASPIVDLNKAISQVRASKYLKSSGVKTPER